VRGHHPRALADGPRAAPLCSCLPLPPVSRIRTGTAELHAASVCAASVYVSKSAVVGVRVLSFSLSLSLYLSAHDIFKASCGSSSTREVAGTADALRQRPSAAPILLSERLEASTAARQQDQ
jgi:hypothetical protein